MCVGMTEKRYILSHNGKEDGILDKTNDKGYYGFELARLVNELSEENEQLKQQLKTKVIINKQYEELQEYKHLVKIATSLIEWNTIPQVRREWKKHLSKVGDSDD